MSFFRRFFGQSAASDLPEDWLTAIAAANASYTRLAESSRRPSYDNTGALNDLQRAIKLLQRIDPFVLPNSSYLILFNLGFCLHIRYTMTGDYADLEKAIELFEKTLIQSPPENYLSTVLVGMADALSDYYKHAGDLKKTVEIAERNIALMPADLPNRAYILALISYDLLHRYERTHDPADLEQAITLAQRAFDLTPETPSPEVTAIMSNLENLLIARYRHTLNIIDLEKTISFAQRILALTPAGSAERPLYLRVLASCLYDRFDYSNDPALLTDLEQAIGYQRAALALVPLDSTDRAVYLKQLGTYVLKHHEVTANPRELDEAIELTEQALTLSAPDSKNYFISLNSLGNCFITRYRRVGNLDDLETAINTYQKILASIPPGSEQTYYLHNLSSALRERYERTGDPDDLTTAVSGYRKSCIDNSPHDLDSVLSNSQEWGNWALSRSAWKEAIEAFQYGLDAIEQILQNQLLVRGKESWLFRAKDLFAKAAYALARNDDLPAAVVVLEKGLARLLAEAFMRQDSTDNNTFYSPTFQQIQQALSQPLAETGEAAVGTYLTLTDVGGLALIVYQGGVKPVWFEMVLRPGISLAYNSSHKSLQEEYQEYPAISYLLAQFQEFYRLPEALDELLPVIGQKIIQPIVEELDKILPPSKTGREGRLVRLIPTGLLSQMPLHAARYTVEGQERTLLDDFTMIYAPSSRVFSLCYNRLASLPQTAPRLLAIGNPLPTRTQPLIFSRFEAEEIALFFKGQSSAKVLCETQATRLAVEDNFEGATHIHFSCHGQFNIEEPKSSGILLSGDVMFTLADLLDRPRFSSARLAVLSACQTAATEFMRLPEEAIGLAAGFLQAGIPGVVGTLWPVNDISTALFMTRFYELHLRGEGSGEGRPLPLHHALRVAQQWLRQVTNRELATYLKHHPHLTMARQVMLEHMPADRTIKGISRFGLAENPEECPFRNPYYWAPFVFLGA